MIITVSREFGASGREVAKLLAKELNYQYFDKEILKETSKVSGLCLDYLDKQDEKSFNSFLSSLMSSTSAINGKESMEDIILKANKEAIINIANKDNVVIVGRCADYILKDYSNVLRVFIVANDEYRISHVASRDNLTLIEASKKIRKMDKIRANYYQNYTDTTFGDPSNYDLCLNVASLGKEKVVKIIKKLVKGEE